MGWGSFSASLASHLKLLLNHSNRKNLKSITADIEQLLDIYGIDAHVVFLRGLLDDLNLREGRSQRDSIKLQLLSTVVEKLIDRSNFPTLICEALPFVSSSREEFLAELSRALKLSLLHQISLGLAVFEAPDLGWRREGIKFLEAKVAEVQASKPKVPEVLLHRLLTFVAQHSSLSGSQSRTVLRTIISQQANKEVPLSLWPIQYDDVHEVNSLRDFYQEASPNTDALMARLNSSASHGKVVEELGYTCTGSKAHLKEVLSLLPTLDETSAAQLVAMMARTHSGLEDNSASYSSLISALGGGQHSVPEVPPSTWSYEVAVDAIREVVPQINWVEAMRRLDQPDFMLPDQQSFLFLLQLFHKATQEPFPIEAICGDVWKNEQGQLSFLRHAVSAPPEVFSWTNSKHKQAPLDGLHANKSPYGTVNQCWLSLDLLQSLIMLAERGHFSVVRTILEHPVKHCPEALLIGLAQCKTDWGVVHEEVYAALLPTYLANHPNSSLVLHRLWPLNRKALLLAMVDMHAKDNGTIPRILDVCQELKALTMVLDSTPYSFAIDLAALAARREYLNLEKWLHSSLNARGMPFIAACLGFLRERAATTPEQLQAAGKGTVVPLSVEMMVLFFKVLQANMGALPPELQEEVKRVYNAAVTINPKLQGAAAEQGTQSTEAFAGDIEEEANSYFQKIYTSQQSIEDVVQMLKAFKVSSKQREQEIFACMIHNLFDEYRFFPKYPDKELCITAILFGSLIQYQLVVSLTLGIALRYVLDALRKPLGSKMFTFGLEALNQFKTRLPEWPQYCSYILQIPHMRQAQPELVEQLERVVSGVAPLTDPNPAGPNVGPGYGDMPSGPDSSFKLGNQTGGGLGANAFGPGVLAQMPMGGHDQSADADQPNEQSAAKGAALASSVPAGAFSPVPYQPQAEVVAARAQAEVAAARPSPAATPVAASPLRKASSNNATLEKSVSFATSLSLDTLMQAESDEPKFPVPDEGTQDKIHFLVNNVSVHNLTQKASQLAHHLTAEYHQWFSQYMVAKRSSIEPNFHMLYLQLLDELKQDRLMRMIVKATVRNIQVLLQSEKIKTNSGERSLLKNLGSWLGQLTIARNKPVLQRDIDPKALILNAYEKGKMIAVIPFVAKMLEACKASKVFRPPNPWLMALLGLLMEMYTEKDLKLNLKFEVEMLFKHLNIAKEDVPPTKLLHKHTRDRTNNSDWAVDKSTLSTVSTAVPAAAIKAIAAVGLPASNAGTPPLPQGPGPVPATPIMPVASAAGAMYPSLLAGSAGGMQTTGASAEEAAAAGGGASVAAMVAASAAPLFTASLEQALPNLHMYVHLNPSLALVADQLQLKRLLPLALDRAIREIVAPVVERSVTIACMTTRELVLKDFAMEPDETRMRKAAHLMVCSLAGSLALVTCKEPLRVSIMTQLRQALMQLGGTGAEQLIEQAVQVATADNLDLGCALIEKAATDKALRDVDEALAPSYAVRRKSREAGQAYYDMSVYAQGRYPSSLPEVLRPKPGHLQPVQQRVYEDFARLPRTPPPPPMPYGPPPPGGEAAAAGTYPLGAMGQPGGLQQLLGQGLGADAAADDIAEAAMEAAMGMEGEKDESGLPSAVRPAGATDPLGAAAPAGGEPLSTGAVIEKYRACSSRIDFIIAKDPNHASYESLAPELLGQLRAALTEVREILRQAQSTGEASLAVAQKAFKRLYEGPEGSGVHVSVHLLLLESIRDVNQRLTKELTQWVIYSDDARKLHQEITEGLVRARLLNLTEFDSHLAKLMNAGRNQAATDFAAHLVRQCIVAEPLATAADFFSVLDVLGKVAQRAGAPDSLATLLEQARSASSSAPANIPPPRSVEIRQSLLGQSDAIPAPPRRGPGSSSDPRADPPGLREQAAAMFEEWARVSETPGRDDEMLMNWATQLTHAGMLKCDDTTERFLHILTELVVAHCLSSEAPAPAGGPHTLLNFAAIDAYARLVLLLVKFLKQERGGNDAAQHLVLFGQALDMTAAVLQRDAEERGPAFNPRPYFRLFAALVMSLGASDPVLDATNIQTLVPIASALLQVQPLRVPGFSFAYLELISHRNILPRLLLAPGQKGWPLFQRLLSVMPKFMEPYLRNAKLSEPVRLLYKGTLRVLLVLLHDFPEFLCDHHFNLCDNIPPSCIQMRNLILSAFPRNMRLPDPFTPNLKVDLLPEISQSPRILAEPEHVFRNKHLHQEVDHYLKTRLPSTFCSDLRQRLLLPPHEAMACGTHYNVPLLNALVLYVGIQAIAQLQSKSPQVQSPITQSAPMDVFQRLVTELDTEGRYLLLNAIANQLRYPNNHTHYFSCVLLFLFAEAQNEMIQEQITRVLLERLIVNRPHPWGLLITFIELIKNPRYNFWSHSFTRCAPEIEKLFESVARSCMGPPPRPSDDELGGVVAGVAGLQVADNN